MANFSFTAGDVSASQTLTDSDHLYASHINELRTDANLLSYLEVKTVAPSGGSADYVGNGTDDSVAIQAAINAAYNLGGGMVFIKSGTYNIGTKITLKTNVHLRGAMRGGVTIKANASMNDRLFVNAARDIGSGSDTDITVENIIFDMNGTNQSGSTAPTTSRIKRLKILNCKFINPYDSLYLLTGSTFDLNYDCIFVDCDFIGTSQVQGTDVVDIGNGWNISLVRCYFYDAKAGSGQVMCSLAWIKGCNVINCKFDGNSNGATFASYLVHDQRIIGNEFINSAEYGIRCQTWHTTFDEQDNLGLTIMGNSIHSSAFDGIIIYGNYNATPLYFVGINIVGNHIYDNQRRGIYFTSYSKYITVANNHIYRNSKAAGGTYFSIDFASPGSEYQSYINVASNFIFDNAGTATQTLGIDLDDTDYARLLGNQVLNCGTVVGTANSGTVALCRSDDTNTKALFNLNITDI